MERRTDDKLQGMVDRIAESLQGELQIRSKDDVVLVPSGEMQVLEIQGWLWLIQREHVVLRGVAKALTNGGRDGEVHLILDSQSAISLAGKCVGADPALLAEHRKAKALQWYLGSLDQLGRVVFAAVDTVLRDQLGPYARIAFTHHGVVRPGFDDTRVLGKGERAVYDLRLGIGQHSLAHAFLAIPGDTAADWNDLSSNKSVDGSPTPQAPPTRQHGRPLRALVASDTCRAVVHESAAQLGMQCHELAGCPTSPGSEEPGQVVVVEVTTDPEAFELATRVRAESPEARVVLLVHEPSRDRVMRGLRVQADAMLGWPATAASVVEKIATLLSSPTPQAS